MNYIYDILLNFKDEYYDFYDWNKSDNIIHIRKIPIFKIDINDLLNIINNRINIDINFLEKIKNKTEVFTSKNIKNIEYACLLSDGNITIGILKQDKKIKISSLLIDEEVDTLEEVMYLGKTSIEYKIIGKLELHDLKTRKQIEIEKFIKKEMNKIKNEEDKLKYIYYDCFNEKEDNIDKIFYRINTEMNNINTKLYNFFKLIEVKR